MSNVHSTISLPKSETLAQLDPSAPIPRAPGTEQGHVIAVVLTFIMVVLTFVVLNVAKIFFAPVLAGFVLGIVLSPLARLWARIGIKPTISAFLTLLVVVFSMVGLALLLEPYVTMVIRRAPLIWNELRESAEGLRELLRGLDELSDRIAAAMSPDAAINAASAAPAEAEKEAMTVPTITDALFYAPTFLTQFMIFAGTLFFFMLSRHEIYKWFGNTFRSVDAEDFERGERHVAKYFLTITTINACFGLLVAGVMQILGMPGAVFWGICAFMLNYVLYLGPIALALTLLVTGIVVFDGFMSVVPPAVYMFMNMMEGQFVTPYFVGQQMRVNPLVVFLSLVFWLWLWGPIGGIIAIPLMIWSIAMAEAFLGQTISSGIPGRLRPNLRAGADA